MNGQSCDTRPQTHMKSLKRKWTLKPLSDSKRMMCHISQWFPNTRTAIQQGDIKTSIRFPEVKTVQRLLICQVLRAQGQCSTGWSMTHTEAPGAGTEKVTGWGRWQTAPLTHFTPFCVWLWSSVGYVLTLSQTLCNSSKVEMGHR